MWKKTPYKIALIVVLMVSAVTYIGMNTYNRLGSILQQTHTWLQPDAYLLELQLFVSGISRAESNVRSYRLTRDVKFVRSFRESMQEANRSLQTLANLPQDEKMHRRVDSLRILLNEKEVVLNEILRIESSEQVTGELKLITKGLEKLNNDSVAAPEPKKGFLNRLFHSSGNKKKKQANADSVLHTLRNQVNTKVSEVQNKQIERLRRQKKTEFEWLRYDNEISADIQRQIAVIEKTEKLRKQENILLAGQSAEEIRMYNLLFAISLSVTLILIGFALINFVHKNNQFTRAIEKARNEAVSLAKTKETFLANMSHEIRTPLTAVIGFAEQLMHHPMPAQQKNQATAIYKSSEFLLHIINDILDYSKMVANKFDKVELNFSLTQVIRDIEYLFALQIREKGIAFNVFIDERIPKYLVGDEMRLKQILINLLSNSIKFTPSGFINLQCNLHHETEGECYVKFMVEDTGIGIEKSKLEKVFDEFEQADSQIYHDFGGTGLGLSICKKLVEFQNGTIELDSTPGEGTRINFIIPYRTGLVEVKQPVLPKGPQKTMAGKHVLIADDEPYNIQLLRFVLEKHGIIITAVMNGKEALHAFEGAPFDFLIVDAHMPEMSGPELIEYIHTHYPGKVIPIVLLSADAPEQTQLLATYPNVTQVSKPFTEHHLMQTLNAFVIGESANAAKALKEKFTESDVDVSELKFLGEQNPDLFTDLIQTFIQSTAEGLVAIRGAAESCNAKQLSEWVHRLSPPCRHIHAMQLLHLLKSLQDIPDKSQLLQTIAETETEFLRIKELLEEELEGAKRV